MRRAIDAEFWPNYQEEELELGTIYLKRNSAHGGHGTEPHLLPRVWETYRLFDAYWDIWHMQLIEASRNPAHGDHFEAGTVVFNPNQYETGSPTWVVNHETAHAIEFYAIGTRYWGGPVENPHDIFTVSRSAGTAFAEGWAEFVTYLIRREEYGLNRRLGGRDYATVWRGEANDGSGHSGHQVEGAVLFALRDTLDYLLLSTEDLGLDTIFAALQAVQEGEVDFAAFFKRLWWFLSPAQAQEVYEIAQWHGMVFCRGGIDGFVEGAPIEQPAAGNTKLIDIDGSGDPILFVRGTVTVQKSALSAEALHVPAGALLSPDKYKVGVKQANTSNATQTIHEPWQWGAETGWANAYSWDTTNLNDGDYDLVIVVRDADLEVWDTLHPHFSGVAEENGGQANAAPNDQDEKWLKEKKTWFRQGTWALAKDGKKGMVRVDNLPPTVMACKPAPN
jgi:hypothetical protein